MRAAIDTAFDDFAPGALRLASTASMRAIQVRCSERYRDRSRTPSPARRGSELDANLCCITVVVALLLSQRLRLVIVAGGHLDRLHWLGIHVHSYV